MRRLPLANNCEVPWEEMKGNDKVRHCASCANNVYDLSAMREIEARALLMLFANERMCITYRTNANDEIIFAEEARRAGLLRRLSTAQTQIGASVVALALAASSGCAPAVSINTGSASQGATHTSSPENSEPHSAPSLPERVPLDTDGDRVPDAEDKCPYEPGPRENLGCPPPRGMMNMTVRGKVEILDQIYFRFRDHNLAPISRPILDAVARTLLAYPDIQRLEIQGHAAGNEPRAQLISEKRAQTIRNFLIGESVNPNRLVAVGYGNERPRSRENSADGRMQNRRVEFTILKRDSCPAPDAK